MSAPDVAAAMPNAPAIAISKSKAMGPKYLIPLISGVSMIYSQVVTAVFGVFLAAFLGAEGFGTVNLARNIFLNALFLTPLGLDLGLQRHLGEAGLQADKSAEVAWLRLVTLGLSSLVVLCIVAGGASALESLMFRHAGFGAVLIVTMVALPLNTDMFVLGGAYRGRYEPLPSLISAFIIQPTIRILAILALSLVMDRLWAAVYGTLLSFVVAWLYIAVRATRDFPVRLSRLRGATRGAARTLRYSTILGLSTFFFAMAKTLDTTALGFFGDLAEVGRYAVAMMMCQLVGTVGNALGQTLAPSIAAAAQAGEKGRIAAILAENMQLCAILSAPLCVVIGVWGCDIDLLLGPSYVTTPLVFMIAAMTQWFFTVAHNCAAALSMTGRHRTELHNNIAALVVEAFGCALLVPRFGMVGAAAATCIMVLLLNAVRQVQIYRMLGDGLLRWRMLTPLLLSVAIALPLAFIGHLVGFRAWWVTGLLASAHVSMSFLALLTLLTSAEQRRQLFGSLSRKMR